MDSVRLVLIIAISVTIAIRLLLNYLIKKKDLKNYIDPIAKGNTTYETAIIVSYIVFFTCLFIIQLVFKLIDNKIFICIAITLTIIFVFSIKKIIRYFMALNYKAKGIIVIDKRSVKEKEYNYINKQTQNRTKRENKRSQYTDEELDAYDLEDWQKDLVKKGDYDPWNFEEEDLEEDDYYYEDD